MLLYLFLTLSIDPMLHYSFANKKPFFIFLFVFTFPIFFFLFLFI